MKENEWPKWPDGDLRMVFEKKPEEKIEDMAQDAWRWKSRYDDTRLYHKIEKKGVLYIRLNCWGYRECRNEACSFFQSMKKSNTKSFILNEKEGSLCSFCRLLVERRECEGKKDIVWRRDGAIVEVKHTGKHSCGRNCEEKTEQEEKKREEEEEGETKMEEKKETKEEMSLEGLMRVKNVLSRVKELLKECFEKKISKDEFQHLVRTSLKKFFF